MNQVKNYVPGMIISRINGDVCAIAKHKDGYSMVIIHNYAYDNVSAEQTRHYPSLESLFYNEHQEGEIEMDGEVIQVDK